MIEVKDLVKNYGSHRAVRNVSFTVEPGHIYGFLGPNGAGKSTTMNIITGTLAATSGSVTINGHDIYGDPLAAKKCIGYLPEIPPLYPDMDPEEYLSFVGSAKGLRGSELAAQIEEVMELTGLTDVRRRMIRNLSKGYRQRVGIAQAMLGDPEIIILDEPTVGLDPKQIIEIRELIRSLGKKHTVILSSHILSEISAVCDHVIIIAKGRIVADDMLDRLESRYSSDCRLELLLRASEAEGRSLLSRLSPLCAKAELLPSSEQGTVLLSLRYEKGRDIRAAVYGQVQKSGLTLLSMIPRIKTLEDIFLELTAAENADSEEERFTASVDSHDTDGTDSETDTGEGGDDYKPLFG